MSSRSGRSHFIRQIEAAAGNEDMPRHELQILLRRAAIRLRRPPAQPPSEPEIEAGYLTLIDGMNRAEPVEITLNEVVRDWLIAHGRLPVVELDEGSETKGNA